jgi:hypothetical protein
VVQVHVTPQITFSPARTHPLPVHRACVARWSAAQSGVVALLSCRTPAVGGGSFRRMYAEVIELEDPSL